MPGMLSGWLGVWDWSFLHPLLPFGERERESCIYSIILLDMHIAFGELFFVLDSIGEGVGTFQDISSSLATLG